jgi:signal transduction histidine kinase
MSHLIDDLLDVSKIEAGIDMELAPQILAPLVEQVVTSLIPQAQKKSINLNYHTPSESPMVEANVTRLQQVIHNLVANAIKYTPDEGVVTVQISPYQDEIRIQVIDTGLGIPAADQPHIFEKFYRVKGDHVASIKGTGLGLAIAKGIVEKHKGRIWLESVFGQGSTFTVALPLHKQPQIKNALVV